MRQYKEMIQHILGTASEKNDRTGVGTISTFGYQTRYDLSEGFPLVSLKKTPFRLIAEELLWFVSGSDMLRPLLEKNVNIWNEWAFDKWHGSDEYIAEGRKVFSGLGAKVSEEEKYAYDIEMKEYCDRILKDDAFSEKYGCLNRVYGKQWRDWLNIEKIDSGYVEHHIDQLQNMIDTIKKNPEDRRLVVTAWNPGEIPGMALPPCHRDFQCYVKDGKLSLMMNQRSNDSFLGVPFNIASYALLTHMIAHVCNLEVGEFIYVQGDLHLYKNQVEQAKEMLKREPRQMPKLIIKRKVDNINDFTIDDFEVVGYDPHPAIKVEVAV